MRLAGGWLPEPAPPASAFARLLRWVAATLLALAIAAGFAAMLVMIVVEVERALAAPWLDPTGACCPPSASGSEVATGRGAPTEELAGDRHR